MPLAYSIYKERYPSFLLLCITLSAIPRSCHQFFAYDFVFLWALLFSFLFFACHVIFLFLSFFSMFFFKEKYPKYPKRNPLFHSSSRLSCVCSRGRPTSSHLVCHTYWWWFFVSFSSRRSVPTIWFYSHKSVAQHTTIQSQ